MPSRHRCRAARWGEAAAESARRPLRAPAQLPGELPGRLSYRGRGSAIGAGGERRVSLHDLPVSPWVGTAPSRGVAGVTRRPPRRPADGGAERPSSLGERVPVSEGVVADTRGEFYKRSGALRAGTTTK